jgi:hypothetical protein
MTLQNSDPEQAIVSYLSQPSEIHAALFPEAGLTAQDYAAQAGTFHFTKKRSSPPFQLHTVQYKNKAGHLLQCLCCLEQDSINQWHVINNQEIKVNDRYTTTEQQQQFHAGQPWVQLSGGGEAPFWASGDVIANGFEITYVRLRSKNGYILEDRVQDGSVVFITNQKIQLPVEVELYGPSDILLRRYIGFDTF